MLKAILKRWVWRACIRTRWGWGFMLYSRSSVLLPVWVFRSWSSCLIWNRLSLLSMSLLTGCEADWRSGLVVRLANLAESCSDTSIGNSSNTAQDAVLGIGEYEGLNSLIRYRHMTSDVMLRSLMVGKESQEKETGHHRPTWVWAIKSEKHGCLHLTKRILIYYSNNRLLMQMILQVNRLYIAGIVREPFNKNKSY